MAEQLELVVQLGVDQMDLPEVGLGRVAAYAREVLDCDPCVRVALDTQALDQADPLGGGLAESMPGGDADAHDSWNVPAHNPMALISAAEATERAPILVMSSATSRSVDTTITERPFGSAETS
jgi:hypothetical protein